MRIELTTVELEAAARIFADANREKWGLAIESIAITLAQTNEQSVDAAARLKVRKGVASTVLNLTARAEITADLSIILSNLACTGEGMLGKLVAPVVNKKLAEHNGREFPVPLPDWLAHRVEKPAVQVTRTGLTLIIPTNLT